MIAPDELHSTVIFDASESYSDTGQPLEYAWGTLDDQFIPLPGTTWSASPYLTNTFAANQGATFYLVAREAIPQGASSLATRLEVSCISSSIMMIVLKDWLSDTETHEQRVRMVLNSVLDRAGQQFITGQTQAALDSLRYLQDKCRPILKGRGRQAFIEVCQAITVSFGP